MEGLRQNALKLRHKIPSKETVSSTTSSITPLPQINKVDPILTTTTTQKPDNFQIPYPRRRHSLTSLKKEERDQEIASC